MINSVHFWMHKLTYKNFLWNTTLFSFNIYSYSCVYKRERGGEYFFCIYILCLYMRVGWKVHRLAKILSWNVTKWGLFSNTFILSVLHCLNPIDQKSHQQQIWYHHMDFSAYDLSSPPSFLSLSLSIYIYIYIYIYICILWQHFFDNTNFIKHNRHFLSTCFLLDPFVFPL